MSSTYIKLCVPCISPNLLDTLFFYGGYFAVRICAKHKNHNCSCFTKLLPLFFVVIVVFAYYFLKKQLISKTVIEIDFCLLGILRTIKIQSTWTITIIFYRIIVVKNIRFSLCIFLMEFLMLFKRLLFIFLTCCLQWSSVVRYFWTRPYGGGGWGAFEPCLLFMIESITKT